MIRKTLCRLLAVIMVVTMMPAMAFAEDSGGGSDNLYCGEVSLTDETNTPSDQYSATITGNGTDNVVVDIEGEIPYCFGEWQNETGGMNSHHDGNCVCITVDFPEGFDPENENVVYKSYYPNLNPSSDPEVTESLVEYGGHQWSTPGKEYTKVLITTCSGEKTPSHGVYEIEKLYKAYKAAGKVMSFKYEIDWDPQDDEDADDTTREYTQTVTINIDPKKVTLEEKPEMDLCGEAGFFEEEDNTAHYAEIEGNNTEEVIINVKGTIPYSSCRHIDSNDYIHKSGWCEAFSIIPSDEVRVGALTYCTYYPNKDPEGDLVKGDFNTYNLNYKNPLTIWTCDVDYHIGYTTIDEVYEAYKEAGKVIEYKFDLFWDDDSKVDQTVILRIDPNEVELDNNSPNNDFQGLVRIVDETNTSSDKYSAEITGNGTDDVLVEIKGEIPFSYGEYSYLSNHLWNNNHSSVQMHAKGNCVGLAVGVPEGFDINQDVLRYLWYYPNPDPYEEDSVFSEPKDHTYDAPYNRDELVLLSCHGEDAEDNIYQERYYKIKDLYNKYKEAGKVMYFKYVIDWDDDPENADSGLEREYTQTITVKIDPSKVTLAGAPPLYGNVTFLKDDSFTNHDAYIEGNGTEEVIINVTGEIPYSSNIRMYGGMISHSHVPGWCEGFMLSKPSDYQNLTKLTCKMYFPDKDPDKPLDGASTQTFNLMMNPTIINCIAKDDPKFNSIDEVYEAYKAKGKNIDYKYELDWDDDGETDQTVILRIDPTKVTLGEKPKMLDLSKITVEPDVIYDDGSSYSTWYLTFLMNQMIKENAKLVVKNEDTVLDYNKHYLLEFINPEDGSVLENPASVKPFGYHTIRFKAGEQSENFKDHTFLCLPMEVESADTAGIKVIGGTTEDGNTTFTENNSGDLNSDDFVIRYDYSPANLEKSGLKEEYDQARTELKDSNDFAGENLNKEIEREYFRIGVYYKNQRVENVKLSKPLEVEVKYNLRSEEMFRSVNYYKYELREEGFVGSDITKDNENVSLVFTVDDFEETFVIAVDSVFWKVTGLGNFGTHTITGTETYKTATMLSVTPAEGYKVKEITGNGKVLEPMLMGNIQIIILNGGDQHVEAVVAKDGYVMYDLKGGTGTVEGEKAYGKGDTVTVATPEDISKEGYVFEGWKSSEDKQIYQNGDTFTMPDSGDGVTMIAQWAVEEEPENKPKKKPDNKEEQNFDCDGGNGCPCKEFHDLDTEKWYHEAMDYVLENELMNGVGEDEFDPNGNTTRAMMWTIMARNEGVQIGTGEDWYKAGQQWAEENGISDGTMFEGKITREQMVTMMYRYAKFKGCDVSVGENTNILSYKDADQISEWAVEAMQWACGMGIINGVGDGYLDPKGNATRAQIAKVLMEFIEII